MPVTSESKEKTCPDCSRPVVRLERPANITPDEWEQERRWEWRCTACCCLWWTEQLPDAADYQI